MNGAQVTGIHDPETIGWIVMESNVQGEIGGVEFETQRTADTVEGHGTCQSFNFNAIDSANSLVVASQQEMDGADGAWTVICDQTNNSVGLHAEEDTVYDAEQYHATEINGFVAFAEPFNTTYDPGWTTVNLQQEYESPVVIITGYENNYDMPLSARVNNITANSFDVTLQKPNGLSGFADDIYYFVIEEGVWEVGDTTIEAHQTEISTVGSAPSIGGTWIGENQVYEAGYADYPVVLHQVMSYNDPSWITSWVSYPSNNFGPPSQYRAQLGLNGAQVTATHDPETVGWVVVENTGTDSVAGTDFYINKPTTEMTGHDNGCTNYTYGGDHTNLIILASQQEMDGADGSWLKICDITGTTVGFHAEEDQIIDDERNHTTEILGYLIFSESFDVGY